MTKEEILSAVDQLEDFGFNSRMDTIGEYSTGGILFYKKIDEQRFIVLHFYNQAHFRGFDCWISTYEKDHHVGKMLSIEMEGVKAGFDFEEDWKLIAAFLV